MTKNERGETIKARQEYFVTPTAVAGDKVRVLGWTDVNGEQWCRTSDGMLTHPDRLTTRAYLVIPC